VVITRPVVPGGIHRNARNESPGYFAARQHRFLHASFCETERFYSACIECGCAARAYAMRAFLFLLRLHRYKPSMMDDRSTTADFAGHGDNEELVKNTRFSSMWGFRSNIHNGNALYTYKCNESVDSLAELCETW